MINRTDGLMSKKMKKNGFYAAFDYTVDTHSKRGKYTIHLYYVDREMPLLVTDLYSTRKASIENIVKMYLDAFAEKRYNDKYYYSISPFTSSLGSSHFTLIAWYNPFDFNFKIVDSYDIFVNDYTGKFDLTNRYTNVKSDILEFSFYLLDTALAVGYSLCEESITDHIAANND